MFKNTIYLILALSAAFTTFAAPTAISAGDLVKKDAVSNLVSCSTMISMANLHQAPQDNLDDGVGLGTGSESLKK
jgi:hypothetical protein